jgi:hypothetical protein
LRKPDLVRVTQALSVLKRGFSDAPPGVLLEAGRLGVEVHSYCLAWVKLQDEFPFTPPAHIAPYVARVQEWYRSVVVDVLGVEIRVEHRALGYKGRLDLIAKIRGDRTYSVIDFKRTMTVDRVCGFQLAAYKAAAERKYRRKFGRRLALKLPPDGGKARAVPFEDDRADMQAFLYAKYLYQILEGGY